MKKMYKNRKQKGITLVSLVVTIIVLLILAGIAINLAVGNNGLFTRAKLAVNEWKNATKEEEHEIDKLIKEMNKLQGSLPDNIVMYYVDYNKTYEEEIGEGKDCLHPKTFTPQKDGWTFLGWREDREASGEVLREKLKEDKALILYAVYKQERTITFNGNGQTSGNIESKKEMVYYNGIGISKDPVIALPTEGFEKTYYHIDEWAVDEKEGKKYKVGESLTIEKDVTLYAIWNQHLEEIELKIDERTYGTPSNTTGDKGTARTFNVNNYLVGIAYDNYYSPTYVSNYSVSSNRIWQMAQWGYGVGIPFFAEPNKTYKTANTGTNTIIYTLYYNSSGQFLETNNYEYSISPNNAYYGVILVFSPASEIPIEQYVNNLKLFKVL